MKLDLEKLPALKNLTEDVRQKAMEYAGQLGARGPRPTTVLGTAVTLATEWKSGRLPPKTTGHAAWLVQPRQSKWILRRANEADAKYTFNNREDAVRRAQSLAKEDRVACLVFGPGGTLVERYEAPKADLPRPAPRPPAEPLSALRPLPAPSLVVVASAAPAPRPAPAPIPAPIPASEAALVAESPVVVDDVAPAVSVVAPEALTTGTIALAAVDEAPEAPAPAAAPTALEAVVAPAAIEASTDLPEAAPTLVASPEPATHALPTELLDGPIRVKRLGAKWAVLAPGLALETFPTKAKAQRRAKELATETGRSVVVA